MLGVTNQAEERQMPLKSRVELALAEYSHKHGKVKKKDLAERIGITPQYLSSILSGNKKVSKEIELLFKIAKELDCKVDDLYEYSEESK
jgi:DNA-binding Xre family transcriptional regulator